MTHKMKEILTLLHHPRHQQRYTLYLSARQEELWDFLYENNEQSKPPKALMHIWP